MAKIVRFHETGGADVLRLEEVAETALAPDEVRIDVKALGLNRAEVAFRSGEYVMQPQLPSRLGYEAAGIVSAIGAGVSNVLPGDIVSVIPGFDFGRYGVYGETATVPAQWVTRHPVSLTFEQAAALWVQYLTAYGALVTFSQLRKGQSVMVTAASSSVGVAAIQIAKDIGATVIATTRGADKQDFLLEAGADHVIISDEEDLVARAMAITAGRGVDVAFDPVAGPFLEKLANAAAFGGTVHIYGALLGEPGYPLFTALSKALTVHAYTFFELTSRPDKLSEAIAYISSAIQAGRLIPVIDSVFTLDKIVDAHRYMESNRQRGKIVVTT
ncbi:zinc-dependent alcohol dehydrogenase family protein [Sphingopyxis sp. 113P3]|uniref:zinc-dependent alcohol dehydrogenase family protein n=1 Tax=Sphingopyxis sp. (strain 113P3) TaxID=292913 RepID=UPI0006AD3CB1|nr:zinc-dependent alcohol dehydrogenase family protein [Sphingopyxis sp. 113P3]ALC11101.1 NADPH:quinone reductase [Sphingopyxis sp. 113P3]